MGAGCPNPWRWRPKVATARGGADLSWTELQVEGVFFTFGDRHRGEPLGWLPTVGPSGSSWQISWVKALLDPVLIDDGGGCASLPS